MMGGEWGLEELSTRGREKGAACRRVVCLDDSETKLKITWLRILILDTMQWTD